MQTYRFSIPTELFYGIGALEKLKTEPLPGEKALVVTGGNSIRKHGILDRVLTILAGRSIRTVLFDRVTPNPVRETVMSGAEIAKAERCDFVIGLGGGSAIDAAKAIAMMTTNPGDIWDYVQVGSGGRKAFPVRGLPLVVIPTTAGTGTEGNPVGVLTKTESGEKVGMVCEFPVKSIVDPELTLGIVPSYTAFQGFDALFHSLEGYLSVRSTPVSDVWAIEGIRNIFSYLPAAVQDGRNLEARTAVSFASMLAGMVICISSCTGAHTIEHSLSGKVPSLPHGEGLILISRAFHAFGARRIPERYALIADAIGVAVPGESDERNAARFLDALEELKIACGVDRLRLSDHGFNEADIPGLIESTLIIGGGALVRDRYPIGRDDLAAMLRASL